MGFDGGFLTVSDVCWPSISVNFLSDHKIITSVVYKRLSCAHLSFPATHTHANIHTHKRTHTHVHSQTQI